jgi:hypothetical protein
MGRNGTACCSPVQQPTPNDECPRRVANEHALRCVPTAAGLDLAHPRFECAGEVVDRHSVVERIEGAHHKVGQFRCHVPEDGRERRICAQRGFAVAVNKNSVSWHP